MLRPNATSFDDVITYRVPGQQQRAPPPSRPDRNRRGRSFRGSDADRPARCRRCPSVGAAVAEAGPGDAVDDDDGGGVGDYNASWDEARCNRRPAGPWTLYRLCLWPRTGAGSAAADTADGAGRTGSDNTGTAARRTPRRNSETTTTEKSKSRST